MPRRYYRRTRVVRPKKKWATNFTAIGASSSKTLDFAQAGLQTISFDNILVKNTSQTANPTPVIVKAGNFKIKGDMRITYNLRSGQIAPTLVSCVIYIIYVPEGVTANASIITAHPEWIIAWSPVDINITDTTDGTQNVNKFSFSSRLKRNLNSGDTIVCLTVFNLETSYGGATEIQMTVSPSILCQYWTCAN